VRVFEGETVDVLVMFFSFLVVILYACRYHFLQQYHVEGSCRFKHCTAVRWLAICVSLD